MSEALSIFVRCADGAPILVGLVLSAQILIWLVVIALGLSAVACVTCWLNQAFPRRSPPPARSTTCRHCGYDLRASRIRCPECGNKIPPRPAPRFVIYRGHAFRVRSAPKEFDQEF